MSLATMTKKPADAMSSAEESVVQGIVHQVNSGDCITIREEVYNGYPKTKTIVLNSVIAPKFGRYAAKYDTETNGTYDEPFSWEAREFLRKKLIGKKVFLKTAGQRCGVGKITRYYGDIFYPTLENNIVNELVENGLVTVKTVKLNNQTPDVQNLVVLQNKAKAAMVGRWNPNAKNTVKKNNSIYNARLFFKKNSKTPIKAVVESVIDGTTMKLLLLPERNMILLHLSGVSCPPEGVELGDEAKFFVEVRLLQKDVEVTLDGVLSNRKTQSFFGTIHDPAGDIAFELVKQGFAICPKYGMDYLNKNTEKLWVAERQAKENKLRYWKYHTNTGQEIAEKEIVGTVIEIIRDEGLLVKSSHSKKLRRIYFSNIIPARLGVEVLRGKSNGNGQLPATQAPRTLVKHFYDIPWAYEAREFLRTRCIGKKVNASVDFVQPKINESEEKICATIIIDGINLGEELVKEGLATVMNNPRDDETSQCLSKLKKAEEIAKQSHKGLYSKSSFRKKCIFDFTSAGEYILAKALLPNLQRFPRYEAVVENVVSGCKMRLHVRKVNFFINFLLAGTTCPSNEGAIQGEAPSAVKVHNKKALAFTKEKIMHRDIEISVVSSNNSGYIIGWLFVGNTNLTVELVKEGLYSLHRSAKHSKYFKLLQQAEKYAKDKKINLWKNYVEEP
ncbi:staphylococcal nuclease domain-containing protein 1-like [Acyrthosiphon pisum]|uniref:TNase-like domain-containing protein n=1 Tax=Acyrthosiphon pisum TaxID=7029 RepID=A0A8R2H8X7_ACYPI|nr:staphylococcal nuclease domain-containing protein 1-like [Acyrthosiphon pisum]|eukprot:XP_016662793.1 PREDICTED: staphylococcal nuclease domain-containing protein 1-like [Acyrthosiphon pisum]